MNLFAMSRSAGSLLDHIREVNFTMRVNLFATFRAQLSIYTYFEAVVKDGKTFGNLDRETRETLIRIAIKLEASNMNMAEYMANKLIKLEQEGKFVPPATS